MIHSLIPFLRPYKKQYFSGFLCIVGTNFFGVLAPLVLKYGIEDLEAGVTEGKIFYYAALIVLIALLAGIFRFFMRRIIISTSRRIEFDLRVKYFAHLQQLSPSFYDHQQTGDLMTRSTSDIEAVRMVFGPAIMYSVDTLITLAFALTVMFTLSIPLTLTVIALAPIMSTLIYFLARNVHKFSLRVQGCYSELNAMTQEHLSGIRVIRSYCQEEPERRLFGKLNREYLNANMKLVKVQAMLFPLFYSIFGIGMAIILYFGGRSIISGHMSLGDFVAYSAYVSMLAWPVIAIGWVLNLFQRGSASMKRIVNILDTQPDVTDQKSKQTIHALKGEIVFNKVCFSYNTNNKRVLLDIDLHIPAGSSLGIVGQVGAGKTTLVSLIPRLYELSSGTLTIGGCKVHTISLDVLRREIAVVPQDSFLFSDRIRDNILFANPELNDDELKKVAEISHISNDITEFNDGYNTRIGERGITLSGGQKQRSCLARALAAQPTILILDDCFSSVDTNTEAEIFDELLPHLKGKTIIIIAHRISTLQWTDNIIILHEGRIVEMGTHDELVKLGGRYAVLYRKQLLEREIREAG